MNYLKKAINVQKALDVINEQDYESLEILKQSKIINYFDPICRKKRIASF
jgi:hypothetical protein